MTSYCRRDVLRILQISSRQLQGWEKAGLILSRETYSFQDLGLLRTLRSLREDDVPAAAIRHSIVAMKAVAGMANPLVEACLIRTGTRLAFRCDGAVVDPIRRQLLFDFERYDSSVAATCPAPLRRVTPGTPGTVQDIFMAAVQAEETGDKKRAIALYEQILRHHPAYAPACINLGTIHFHLRQLNRAEELYRRAAEIDPGYVLAFFDLGNVLDELDRLDESIAAYRQALALAPRYADAHYNLALAFERRKDPRAALRHWHAYLRLDKTGPWAEHARNQTRKILDSESLSIAWRSDRFIPPRPGRAKLHLAHRRHAAH
ncbi:MAG TPA: tetratricopeptide repeat protein [Terracidiphilus sp.]|nr:tetratricopeptide repeat protein [Terracidiphilus sp.]